MERLKQEEHTDQPFHVHQWKRQKDKNTIWRLSPLRPGVEPEAISPIWLKAWSIKRALLHAFIKKKQKKTCLPAIPGVRALMIDHNEHYSLAGHTLGKKPKA